MADTPSGLNNMADLLDITVKTLQRGAFPLRVTKDTAVTTIKEQLAPLSEIPTSRQRLIFKGRVLQDDQTLQEIGIESGNALHLVERPVDAPPASGPVHAESGNRSSVQQMPGLGAVPANMQDFGRFLGGVLSSLAGGAAPVPGAPTGARGPFGAGGPGPQAAQPRDNMHLLVAVQTYLTTLESSTQAPPPIPVTSLHPRLHDDTGAAQQYHWLTTALRALLENTPLHADLQSMLHQASQELDSTPPPPPPPTSGLHTANTGTTTHFGNTPAADTFIAVPAASGPAPVPGQLEPTLAGGFSEPGRPNTRRPPPPPYPYTPLIIPAIAGLVQRAHDYSTGPLAENLQSDITYLRHVHSLDGNRPEVVSRIRELTGRLHAAAALFTELARASAAACLAAEGNAAAMAFNTAAVLTSDGTQPSFPRLLPRSDAPHIADAFIVRGDIDPSQLPSGLPPFPPGMFMMPNMGSSMPGASAGSTPGPTTTPAESSGAQTPAGPDATPPIPDLGQGAASGRFGPFVTPAGTAFGGFSIQGDGPLDIGQQLMNMFSGMPGAQVMQGPTTTTIAVTSAQFSGEGEDMAAGTAPAESLPGSGPPTAGPGGMPAGSMPNVNNLRDLPFPDMGAIRIDMADVSLPQLLQQFQGLMGGNFMQSPQQQQPTGDSASSGTRTIGGHTDQSHDMSAVLQAISPVIQNIVQNVVANIDNSTPSAGSTSAAPGVGATPAGGGPAVGSAAPASGAESSELRSAVTDAVSSGLEAVLSTISRNLDSIENGLRQVEQRTGQEADFMEIMRQLSSVLSSSFPHHGTSAATAAQTSSAPTSGPFATPQTGPSPTGAPAALAAPRAALSDAPAPAGASLQEASRSEGSAPASTPSAPAGGPSMPPRGLGGALKATSAKRKAVSAAAKSASATSSSTVTPPTAAASSGQPDDTVDDRPANSSSIDPAAPAAGGTDWSQLLAAAGAMRSAQGAGGRAAAPAETSQDPMASMLGSLGGLATQLGSQDGGSGSGGGGGLGNLFQMAGRIASDPAMRPMLQHAATELFGSQSGGGGGGLGNLLGSLLGAGSATGHPSSHARSSNPPPPNWQALSNMDISDAEEWRGIMEADEAVQASMPRQPAFSDAYLAGAPPRSKSLFKKNDDSAQG